MTRTANISRRKATGAHYTPLALGRFVANRILCNLGSEHPQTLRVMDPACGAGALLEAFESAAQDEGRVTCEYTGVEADQAALESARLRLGAGLAARLSLVQGDFLEMACPNHGLTGLWGAAQQTVDLTESFDVVIANPPYVRTQVLGTVESRRLAERFGLSGRVDLYQAFLVAATTSLRPGGVIGIIVSNRFLTTVTGAAVRRYLADRYEICEVIDLGDTKLFEAAVLPAVIVGRRKKAFGASVSRPATRFLRIYSVPAAARHADAPAQSRDIYDVLEQGKNGIFRVPEGIYRLSTGTLDTTRDTGRVWALTTPREARWVEHVRSQAFGYFADIAHIRVGIKTTADSVFIRSDWEALPAGMRPEASLLLPLLGHEDARRWARKAGAPPAERILYPHEMRNGRRSAIDLAQFAGARRYLESHEARLRDRRYLAESGRKWYEIWVPQDPSAWAAPKVVFPDISPAPCFFLDTNGSLVNGNCYWMTLRPGVPEELLYLLLGLANSDLMTRFHDLAFGNKLYAGRRRYITQYVGKYPYPDPTSRPARLLVAAVRELVASYQDGIGDTRQSGMEAQIERLAHECFGLEPE